MKVRFNLDDKERFSIWESPVDGEEYLCGADVSEGLKGGNASCIQVVKRSQFKQVAVWWGYIEPYDFGRVCNLVGYYYNTALLAVERNNNGITVIDQLRNAAYPNLYHMQTYDRDTMDYTERLGWITTAYSRGLLIDALRDAVRDNELLINDPETLAEMKTFVRNPRSGKIEAATGSLDDRVIALGIVCYLHKVLPYSKPMSNKDDSSFLEYIRSQNPGYFSGVNPGKAGY